MLILKYKKLFPSFLFVFVFLAQQIYSFVGEQFKLVSVYWLVIIAIIILTYIYLPKRVKKEKLPTLFMLVGMVGAILSMMNGTGIGEICQKVFYCFMGYVGYLFVRSHNIQSIAFDVLMIILYLFFYKTYFSLDFATRWNLDGDLYGHSSSNTIAISLNMALLMYYVLKYKQPNFRMFIFAITNLILIAIQGSRAGLLVSVILFVIISLRVIPRRYFVIGFITLTTAIVYLIVKNFDIIIEVVDLDNMQGMSSYNDDIRSRVQQGFFSKMALENFLFGYPPNFNFNGDITRSFNAFLDFWGRYGIIAMFFLVIYLIKRILRYKLYKISIITYLPLLAYSFFESLWGGTLWDIFIYIVLFYTGDYVDKRNHYKVKTTVETVESPATC